MRQMNCLRHSLVRAVALDHPQIAADNTGDRGGRPYIPYFRRMPCLRVTGNAQAHFLTEPSSAS